MIKEDQSSVDSFLIYGWQAEDGGAVLNIWWDIGICCVA